MKKVFLSIVMTMIGFAMNAQDSNTQTEKGKFVIEANTGSAATGNTSFRLTSVNGNTDATIGLDGGYFVADDLAVKFGLGSDFGDVFTYKVGGEYYIASKFPVGVDFTGVSGNGSSSNFVGVQGGYAYFIGEHVSIKPAIRYNIALDEGDNGAFQGLIGFAIYL